MKQVRKTSVSKVFVSLAKNLTVFDLQEFTKVVGGEVKIDSGRITYCHKETNRYGGSEQWIDWEKGKILEGSEVEPLRKMNGNAALLAPPYEVFDYQTEKDAADLLGWILESHSDARVSFFNYEATIEKESVILVIEPGMSIHMHPKRIFTRPLGQ